MQTAPERVDLVGFFYKLPDDLKQLESMVLAVGQEMAAFGKGSGRPEILEDMLPDTVSLMQSESSRLFADGRSKDLKELRKHLLSVGKYMDNTSYNRLYYPFVRDNLSN